MFMYKFFCGHMLSFLLDVNLEGRIAGPYDNFVFNYLETSQVSKAAALFYIPTSNPWWF